MLRSNMLGTKKFKIKLMSFSLRLIWFLLYKKYKSIGI